MRSRRQLLAILIALLTLVGIGIADARGRNVENVTILMPAPFADATSAQVKRFNREHRGDIHLAVMRGPLETESISDLAISSLLLGNPPFDALLIDITWLPKYAEAGWLEPLDAWFDKDDRARVVNGARLGNSYDNHLYRWPFNADVGMLYWRRDLMPEPPKTPEDLVRISKTLQNNRSVAYGFVWQGRQYEGLSCDFVEVLHGFGGSWLEQSNGRPGLDTPEARAAASWMQNLILEGVTPKAVTTFAEAESLQAFKAGDAAFMRNWPYAFAELQAEDSAVRGKVGITTMVAQPGQQPGATLGSWGLSVLRSSNHQQAAVTAVRYLTSEEAQRERFLGKGYTPTAETLFQDPELQAISPALKSIAEALNIAVPRPPSPLYAQLSDVLQRQMSATLTERVTADEAMNDAQNTSDIILKSAGALR